MYPCIFWKSEIIVATIISKPPDKYYSPRVSSNNHYKYRNYSCHKTLVQFTPNMFPIIWTDLILLMSIYYCIAIMKIMRII